MSDFFNWGDEITNDGEGFVTLMPGTYPARIINIEKSRHTGSGKMSGCPTAIITLKVYNGEEEATVKDTLFLAASTEWKIGQFLIACGLKEKGEPVKIDRILKAVKKPVKVNLICKADKDHNNRILEAEEAQQFLDSGLNVFNNVSKYSTYVAQTNDEDDSDSEFGF